MAHSFAPSSSPITGAGPNQPDLNADAVWEAKVDLAACFRMAARYGLEEGICNHFSALVPGYDDLFIVNPLSGRQVAGLFSTHPPIQDRVARLRRMRFAKAA